MRILYTILFLPAVHDQRIPSMKKLLFVALAALLFDSSLLALEKFRQIRINVPNHQILASIWDSGTDFEGSTGKIGGPMEFVVGDFELQQLSARNIPYEVIIDDLAAYTSSRISSEPFNPLGFGYGSMGGFYTFTEVLQQLDSMHTLYPNLITVRDSVGGSHEGRALWAVKISDNPTMAEPDEPEVLYTALHHAREPQGMMTVLYYMWWLLEHYGTDPEATYLINNRQLWFIPVVNPDGYVYNQTTNPNGGGFWRKNRRNNGGSYGVDPNRNYGPFYMWNSSNGGSSTSPSSDTYRGPAPFSEPENQTIDAFMRSHNIRTCFNYHTYSNLLIFPWGYASRESNDSLLFREWSYHMIANNHYTSGTDLQTVNYSTRGNSDDYMYGDTTKPQTYTMTPEVGTTGFWPSQAEILPLAIENLPMNNLLAHYAGSTPKIKKYSFVDSNGNGFVERGENFVLTMDVFNAGVGAGSDISVTVSSTSPFVNLTPGSANINTLAGRATAPVALNGTVAPNAPSGISTRILVNITDLEGYTKNDTLTMFIGIPTLAFADSADNGTANWSTGQGWGVSTDAFSGLYSFTDSPTGNYQSNANNALTLNSQVNLLAANYVCLKYWTKWAVEPTWDFALLEVSSNNGATWTNVRTPHSHSGSGRSGGQQPANAWGYESFVPGLTWIEEAVDLSAYAGSQIRLRFRLASDGGEQRDGFYVDNIRVYAYTTSVDTIVTIAPLSITLQGVTGTRLDDSFSIHNNTSNPVSITIAESLHTTVGKPSEDSSPVTFSTIINDARGDNFLQGVDVLDVQYQIRTIPVIGSLLDLKIRMVNPDSAVAGFISLDTDQDFGTGQWPVPWMLGPAGRDVGSEYEILVDVSGRLADSLGLGNNPVAAIFRTSDNSLVLPLFPTITHDSVLTVVINSIPLGTLGINDPDHKINVASTFARIEGVPLPDYAPDWGHGAIEGESGVSWMRVNTTSLNVNAGDSATIPFAVLAAKPPGTYGASFLIDGIGQGVLDIPVQLMVNSLGLPKMQLSATGVSDTLGIGASSNTEITITNNGSSTLYWFFLDSTAGSWHSVAPTFGATNPSSSTNVTVGLNAVGLTPNTLYIANVILVSNDSSQSLRTFPVQLFVPPSVSVDERHTILPTDFALHQNYPNPFNPQTTIAFDLPRDVQVKLKLYNVIGQEIGVLLDERMKAGYHAVQVSANAHRLTSGVYFYRIIAGEFSSIRKMILLQ